MKVLVACEESQEVCTAFRVLGHEAYRSRPGSSRVAYLGRCTKGY